MLKDSDKRQGAATATPGGGLVVVVGILQVREVATGRKSWEEQVAAREIHEEAGASC